MFPHESRYHGSLGSPPTLESVTCQWDISRRQSTEVCALGDGLWPLGALRLLGGEAKANFLLSERPREGEAKPHSKN